MTYKAYIKLPTMIMKHEFETLAEAMQWIANENNNYEHQAWIETYEHGRKKDGFVYTE